MFVRMTRPIQRRQAFHPTLTSVVTRYSSLLGVQSDRVICNPLPVHPYVQANERTESNSIIELLVRKPEMNKKEMVCE